LNIGSGQGASLQAPSVRAQPAMKLECGFNHSRSM
jgi:hypothetical protein